MPDELDLDNLDPAEPENWKRLRDYARRQQDQAREAESVRRENAFLRAGIDLSGRLGQAFAQTYAGKLDDLEAIRADAQDFDPRILQSHETPSVPAQETGEPVTAEPQETGTAERQTLADGAPPANAETGDPKKASIDRARALLDEGRPWEVAAGEMVAMRARAVHDGSLTALDRAGRRVNG